MPFQKGNTYAKGNTHRQGIRKGNECIALENNCIGILLNHGKIAVINAADYYLIEDYTWHAHKNSHSDDFYAQAVDTKTDGKQKHIVMTRLIMGVADSAILVDHISHDTLDNRRDNLRLASPSENSCNHKVNKNNVSSGVKNIEGLKSGSFSVRIAKNGKKLPRKTFKTRDEAVEYKRKMLFEEQVHGQFGFDG